MTTPNRIPLFPLDVVLFPTMPLSLHVFEPRYKVMIRRCLEEPIDFGIVLATKTAVASVGCTARIVRRVKDYPDGRMDILTEGVSVFRLARILDENEYHEGIVEFLADDASSPDPQQEKQLRESFESCHLLLFGTRSEDASQPDALHLAYRMASRLPIDLLERQKLLEMRSERDRREFLERWMVQFKPEFAQRRQKQQRAGSNGHGA
jgi:Lon protease-like protein